MFDAQDYERLLLSADGRQLTDRAYRPRRRAGERRGLLGRDQLADRTVLVLSEPLVHMIGMRFALDLVFVSRRGTIVAVHRNVRPGLRMRGHWRARRTLEMAAGQAEALGLHVGRKLTFSAGQPPSVS
jgi:uncharacterized membrane protein (UPF0127 family)